MSNKLAPQNRNILESFQYLTENRSELPTAKEIKSTLTSTDLILFKLDKITFEEEAPRQEALENVFAALRRCPGINFVYLIKGNRNGVNFYFGLSKDIEVRNEENIKTLGNDILKSSLEGNFRGSSVRVLEEEEKREIIDSLTPPSEDMFYATMDGVPGISEDDSKKNFQSVDRLVDVMLGDNFGFMVIAHPVRIDEIRTVENDLYSIYDLISFAAKQSIQYGSNQGVTVGRGENSGTSANDTEGYSDSEGTNVGGNEGTSYNRGKNEGTSYSKGKNDGTSSGKSSGSSSSGSNSSSTHGTNESSQKSRGTSEQSGESQGTSWGESRQKTHNISYSSTTNEGISSHKDVQKGSSTTISMDYAHKNMQEWMKYFDEVILPRLDYGHGKGIFITSSLLWADNERVLKKLGNTATALFAGDKGNRIPFNVNQFPRDNNHLRALRLFQQPVQKEECVKSSDEWKREIAFSHTYLPDDNAPCHFYLGSWMSVKELAVMAGIPQKEVVGLQLREEVEFGLNVHNKTKDKTKEENEINLGKLVVSGNVKEITVNIPEADLDRHIFVTGVTGAGKTTTCQNLIIDSGLPFLIIEPAKTEYRILRDMQQFGKEKIHIFTIGSNTAVFKLNPFQFSKDENITSRVDMVKASIEAAFDMEAAIPQIIEQSIYDSYKKKGWNISANENRDFKDPFAPDADSFPTMSDVLRNVEASVDKHGFDSRLKNDYIGSIKARLQGLILGSKGMMLNCCHSIDFYDLLDMRVILELEELRDSGQKSLVMGFILINLLEAIRRRFREKGNQKHPHITLIEEAHRLLSKPQPGETNKQHGVDTFTDMLAEIRKYGESLIIADQIPNKLTPEVLKNTNTKIVHRLFAQDDKDAIGNTMALTEEQRNFLSNLEVGRAIVFNGNWPKAVQVQIKQTTDTSNTSKKIKPVTDEDLEKDNLEFYISRWNKGIVDNFNLFGHKPTQDEMKKLLRLRSDSDLEDAILELKENKDKKRVEPLTALLEIVHDKDALFNLLAACYLKEQNGGFLKKVWDAYSQNVELAEAVKRVFILV